MLSLKRCRNIDTKLYQELLELWNATGISNPARSDSLESLRHSLENNGCLILAYEDQKVCGTAWLTHDFRRLYIHHMAVLPQKQDTGIGRKILQEALVVASELGYQAKLEVHHSNARALHLYREFGFTELEGYFTMIRRQK